jgi:hypothetical protein
VRSPLTARRAHRLVEARTDLPLLVEPGVRAVVIGGGIAGTTAAPGQWARRGLYLAGGWVRMPFPAALMERAAASAVLAVNAVLEENGAGPEPVLSVVPRGLLALRS